MRRKRFLLDLGEFPADCKCNANAHAGHSAFAFTYSNAHR
jgi:hypothetical protein